MITNDEKSLVIQNIINTQDFATLPPVAAKVLAMLQKEDVHVNELSKVIEADASLTIKLLRVANSPVYASRSEIKTIHQAIITMGLKRLTNIVLGVSIFSKFLLTSKKDLAEYIKKFWWHASCTAMVAKAIVKKLNINFREYEFIGGLLHDIGKLALLQYDTEKYKEVIELVQNKHYSDSAAELEVYGLTHNEVGQVIADNWKLPETLSNIISYHEDPHKAGQDKEIVAIIRIADELSEIWGASFFEGVYFLNLEENESWMILNEKHPELATLDLESFTYELEQEFAKSSEFLNILIKDAR